MRDESASPDLASGFDQWNADDTLEGVRSANPDAMTIPLIMLSLLVAPYVAVCAWGAVTMREFDLRNAAAIGLAILFVFTASGHFVQTELMAQMLPPWVPGRIVLVYVTGVLELLIAAGLLVRKIRRVAAWVAAAVLVLFFPANIYAAINHVAMGGHAWGPIYLLIRAPLQIIILWWAYWFCIRPVTVASRK